MNRNLKSIYSIQKAITQNPLNKVLFVKQELQPVFGTGFNQNAIQKPTQQQHLKTQF